MTAPARPIAIEELLTHTSWVRAVARSLLRDKSLVEIDNVRLQFFIEPEQSLAETES